MKPLLLALLCSGLLLSACASAPSSSAGDPHSGGAPLTGRHWSLVEVDGHPVTPGPHEAYLQLDESAMRYSASGGCNGLGGAFELRPGSHIHFSQGMHTMMACQTGMDTEGAFSSALERADSYVVDGDTLTLGAGGMPLARFKAQ